MKLTLKLGDFSALNLKVKYMIQAAQLGLKEGVSEAAGLFEAEAKTLVPVLTGRLRDSIHTETLKDEPDEQVLVVTPVYVADNKEGFEPPYARRVEFGFVGKDSLGRNYHQAAQPYMRPSFDTKKEEAAQAVKDSIIARLDEQITRPR